VASLTKENTMYKVVRTSNYNTTLDELIAGVSYDDALAHMLSAASAMAADTAGGLIEHADGAIVTTPSGSKYRYDIV
jgi:hypothetical protein